MNKTVIVSGGSKGIGAAIAARLQKAGYNLIILSRSKGVLDYSAQSISHIPTDFNDEGNLQNSVLEIEKIKNIWAVINNCAGPTVDSTLNVTKEKYIEAFQKHLFASDAISKSALKQFIKNGGGRIINIMSVTTKVPLEGMIISNTIRGAMLNWSKTISKEYARYNVTVNNVLPGYTSTERLAEVIKSRSYQMKIEEEEYVNKLISQIPMRRFGKPEEIASLVNFLVSDESSYINGVSIPVDGGWTSCS